MNDEADQKPKSDTANAQQLSPFDFNQEPGLQNGAPEELGEWLSAFCALLGEYWQTNAQTDRTFSARYDSTVEFKKCRENIEPTTVAYLVHVGAEATPTIMLLDRQPAIACSLELIGENCSELPEDRDVSQIETTSLDYFFEQFSAQLAESWPGPDPIPVRFASAIENPHRTRLLEASERVVIHHIEAESSYGKHSIRWIAPEQLFDHLFTFAESNKAERTGVVNENLELISRSIEVEARAVLGETTLLVGELANLKPGDVIILDQRIAEPIPVHVGGQRCFLGWPTKSGITQSIEIQTVQ